MLKRAMGGVRSVYFIEEVGTGRIKIGVAKDPDKRLRHLQGSASSELRLLAAVEIFNPFSVESLLHEKFADHRVRGEWFSGEVRWLPELLAASSDSFRDLCDTVAQ